MPVTKNYGFPLYDPEDSPDLTPTGREAAAIVAIDEALKTEETGRIEGDAGLNAALEKETSERKAADKVLTDDLAKEVTDRKAADTALGGRIDAEATAREGADTALGGRIDAEAVAREGADTALGCRIDTERADREAITGDIVKQLAKEKADRESADTALGSRIDNAETEISANSADLTGIKSLTYGDAHIAFLENNNGEYDSPALQEIAEQIAEKVASGDLNVAIYGVTTFKEVQAMLPNVVCQNGDTFAQLCLSSNASIRFFTLPGSQTHEIYQLKNDNTWGHFYAEVGWAYVLDKPFKSVGTGLNTASGSLSLDTSYLPTVSAGSGVTVTPTTDGNHTKYEIASTGGASTGGTNVTVSAGQTGLTVTPTTDGDSTRYEINLKAATKFDRGGVTIGSGLNVNNAGIISVDTAALPTLSPSAGILIDMSTSGGRAIYTVQANVDEKTIGYNDDDQLTVLSTSTGGITGDTTWSELES